MEKTFKDLVQETLGSAQETKPEEKKEPKPQAVLSDNDNLDCLICSVLKALGLTNGLDDYKPSRLEHLLGGNSEVIITMGGPEMAYESDGFSDMLKDVIGSIKPDKKYTTDDIKKIRENKKDHGASMKKLLALMDDEHVLRAFNGMQLFKSGGNIQKEQNGAKQQQTQPYDDQHRDNGQPKSDTIEVKIGDNTYHLWEARTEDQKQKGLQGVRSLGPDQGMIFYYDKPRSVDYWMKDTRIPLRICYFNEDFECIAVHDAAPMSTQLIHGDDVQFVVELNQDADVKPGDELDLPGDDDEYVMEVLGSDGEVQYQLKSGQRIMSRKSTKVIITKAKRAWKNRKKKEYEKYCASLGRYVFKELDAQDGRDAEYVQLDKDKK